MGQNTFFLKKSFSIEWIKRTSHFWKYYLKFHQKKKKKKKQNVKTNYADDEIKKENITSI